MVSKGNCKLRVNVAYRIALAVGQEVHGVAIDLQHICQDTAPYIPLCNRSIELKPPSRVHTRSDVQCQNRPGTCTSCASRRR